MKKTYIFGIFIALLALLSAIVIAEFKSDENLNMLGNDVYNATNVNATYIYQNGNIVLDTSSTGITANYSDNANYSTYSGTAVTWAGITAISDLYYKILVDWLNVTNRPTHLSNFSDDLDYSDKNVNYSEVAGNVKNINISIHVLNSSNDYSDGMLLGAVKEYCYQESVNVSTACGGLDTGDRWQTGDSYFNNPSHMYDGNLSTFGEVALSGRQLWENYKVFNGTYGAIIGFSFGNTTHQFDNNYTVPSVCWDYASSTKNLTIVAKSVNSPPPRVQLYCRNTSGDYGEYYEFSETNLPFFSGKRIYEIRIYWLINNSFKWYDYPISVNYSEYSNVGNYSTYAGTLLGSVENANYSTYAGTLLGSVENANFSTYAGELNKEYTRGLNWTQINSGTFPSACPSGTYLTQVNHSTTCSAVDSSDFSVNYSTTAGTAVTWAGSTALSDIYYKILVDWYNVTGRPTHLGNFTDNLDYSDKSVNYSTNSGTSAAISTESDLNVNSSNYWDGLDSPSDISAGEITDDGTYIASADEGNLNVNSSSYVESTGVLNEAWVNESGDTMSGNLTMSQNSLSDVGIIGFNSTDGPRIYYNGTHLVIEG